MDQSAGRRKPGPKPMHPDLRRRGVNISLPPSLLRVLDALAAERGVSRSVAAVDAIKAGIAAIEVAERLNGRAA